MGQQNDKFFHVKKVRKKLNTQVKMFFYVFCFCGAESELSSSTTWNFTCNEVILLLMLLLPPGPRCQWGHELSKGSSTNVTYQHHVILFSFTKCPTAGCCSTPQSVDSSLCLFSEIRCIFSHQIFKTFIFFPLNTSPKC